MKCVNRAQIQKNRQLAGQVCISLGFSGYSSHNVSMVDENGEIKQRPGAKARESINLLRLVNRRFQREAIHFDNMAQSTNVEEIVGARQQCSALYVECVPHATIPIDTKPNEQPIPSPPEATTVAPTPPDDIPPATVEPKPAKPTKPDGPPTETSTVKPSPPKPIKPPKPDDDKPEKPAHEPPPPHPNVIEPQIRPGQTPTVIVPFEEKNETVHLISDNFKAAWTASVFIDGDLACIGVLLDRFWVLVESSCMSSVE